jgi:hypothetical protein
MSTPSHYRPKGTTMLKTDPSLIGARIELSPATDAWMRGDRYGVIVKAGRKYLHVLMDRSGRMLRIAPEYVNDVISTRV